MAAVLAAALAVGVRAETGVTDTTITLGMSAPFTGANGAYGSDLKAGASLYFSQVNATGGINGRKIELVSIDDSYDPAKAVSNTKKLIEEQKVFALFSYYGTATTAAVLPVISAARVPLFNSITGADSLRAPVNRYLFFARASYNDETAAIVEQLVSLGMKNIAVLYQNDGFGKAGLEGITAALKARNMAPTATGVVERGSTDVAAAVKAISEVKPQAVIMVTLHGPGVEFVRRMAAAGHRPQFITLSPMPTDLVYKELGDDSRGIGVSQVMPYPWSQSLALVKEYQEVLAKSPRDMAPSYYSLEGFVAAKILVEAMKRAGKDLTRDKLIAALESMNLDLGGYRVSYSPTNHGGSKFVELTVMGRDGKLMR